MLQTRQLRLRERVDDCPRARSQKVVQPGLRTWPSDLCSYSGTLSALSRPAPQERTTPSPLSGLQNTEFLTSPPKPSVTCHSLITFHRGRPNREAPLGRMSAPSDGPKRGVSRSFFFVLHPGTRVLCSSQHAVHLINHPGLSALPNLASIICTLVGIIMKQL